MDFSQLIKTEQRNGVFILTLNRPDVLNSFNRALGNAVIEALTTAAADGDVRAIVLTASGRAFCAGQDLSEAAPIPGQEPKLGEIVRECYNPIIKIIREAPKPVVCAVNGVAAGAGANLAYACDIVLASEGASFIQSFAKVGLVPDSGGTFMLPRLVGLARAIWMTFLGERLTANEALSYGLIYKVCPAETLMSETLAVASTLAALPTRGLALTKQAFNRSFEHSLQEQLSLEEEMQQEAGITHDYTEGVQAFLEKRKPNFKGK